MILQRRILAALLVVVCLGLAHPVRADALTVRIGFASIGEGNRQAVGGSAVALANLEPYVADEFKNDPGVKIEWYFFRGAGPAVNEAIANGQLDFASQGDLPAIIGRANGLKTRLIMANGAHAPTYLAVRPDSDIQRIEDLKGRKVALHFGTNNQLAVAKVLAAHGLTERSLKFINMDAATATAALISGDVDASFDNYPLLALAERGDARIAYSTKGEDRAFGRNSHLLVTDAFASAHPDITARLVKAILRAAYWSSQEENRQQLLAIWARSGIAAKAYGADLEGETLKWRNSPIIDDFFKEQYRAQAVSAKALGLVRRDVDINGWFDTSFLDQGLKDLGLETFWDRLDVNGKRLGM
ncbi:sulfonate transport system substrate-binding protein [Arboricoccus pini]|uniref:Sulfonate transport system substrate-binding protein n=1 Tax=Arboricoccus pini TaxID=1963835 RepID=A0A212RFM7_9PROT|nr:ABC transporter substrate-binding protein [Arboricoccus pini]SNB71132.1 sulfonate transport system substrate-binding protein [Arboricoccus pini]